MLSRPTSLVTSARREAILCGLVFVVAVTYTVVTCERMGYRSPDEPLKFVLGFPDWIFWGIIIPWGACTCIAALFSFVIMQDHAMEESAPPPREEAQESDAAESNGFDAPAGETTRD